MEINVNVKVEKDITLNVTAENKVNTDSYTLKILREKMIYS